MTRADLRERLATSTLTEAQRTYLRTLWAILDATDAGLPCETLRRAQRVAYRAMTDAERDGVQRWSEEQVHAERQEIAEALRDAYDGLRRLRGQPEGEA